MGWSLGFDRNLRRDVGYGVPAICDDPECSEAIDRGLSYVCGSEPFGGDRGCGLHFCGSHRWYSEEGASLCRRCREGAEPFLPKPDTQEWLQHKLTDPSWEEWRQANPDETARMAEAVALPVPATSQMEGE